MQDVNRLKYESALPRHFFKTLNWMREKRLKVLGLIQRNRWNWDLNPHISSLKVHFSLKCNYNTSGRNHDRDLQTNDPGIRIRDRRTGAVRVEPRKFAVGSTSVTPSWVKNKRFPCLPALHHISLQRRRSPSALMSHGAVKTQLHLISINPRTSRTRRNNNNNKLKMC